MEHKLALTVQSTV